MKYLFVIMSILWLLSSPLEAQDPDNTVQRDQMFSVGVNSDAFAGLETGYSRNTGISTNHDIQLYLRLSLPLLLNIRADGLKGWEIKVGANYQLPRKGRFGLIGDMQLYMIRHRQVLGTFLPIGIKLRITPAYYFSKSYLGFQVTWNQTIATRILHSRHVNATFQNIPTSDNIRQNSSPRDGWYTGTGSQWKFGLEGEWDSGRRVLLFGEIGVIQFSSPYTDMFDAMMLGQVPFYMTMRMHYKL